jgi:hypothetical protein
MTAFGIEIEKDTHTRVIDSSQDIAPTKTTSVPKDS